MIKETPVNELRCAVGPILGKSDNKPVKEEMELMIKHGYKIFHLPDPGFVVTTCFPFRTSLSILIAIQRVYPRNIESNIFITRKLFYVHPYQTYLSRLSRYPLPIR